MPWACDNCGELLGNYYQSKRYCSERCESTAPKAVNLNRKIRVRLTDYGVRVLQVHWDEEDARIRAVAKDWPKRTVSEAQRRTLEGQMWDLMNIFGPTFWIGNPETVFVDNEIQIIEE